MPDRIKLGPQRQIIERWIKGGKFHSHSKKRAEFLLRWDAGEPLSKLAEHIGGSRKMAHSWQTQYWRFEESEGLNALSAYINYVPVSGRPSRVREQVKDAIGKLPPGPLPSSAALGRQLGVPARTIRYHLRAILHPSRRAR